jgi:capsular exopolysaccharide synthesis family protein
MSLKPTQPEQPLVFDARQGSERVQANGFTDGPSDYRQSIVRPATDYRGMDYRAMDYRAMDYRGMDYRGTDYRGMVPDGEVSEEGIDWAGALWRYRYALLIPTLVGIALSAAFFTTRPNYYRSTARLVVESDRPTVLDANSGEVVSGVPPAELLLMQLQSEQVLDFAANHPLLADPAASMSRGELLELLALGIVFENGLQGTRSDNATAFLLHFDHTDPQFAMNAVAALSAGLQNYFTERSETSVTELKRLITTAKDKLLPDYNQIETEYRAFRENTELTWDKTGIMINPYREKQLALQSRRLQLEDQLRDLGTKMAALRSTIESTQNPLLVVEVARQLLGDEIGSVRTLLEDDKRTVSDRAIQDEDFSLASISIERTLLPLEVEREQFAAQFGAGHPSVRQLDQRIAAMREKLNEVTAQETTRKLELRRELESPSGDELKARIAQAELSVQGFVTALETRETVLRAQMKMIDDQNLRLGDEATKLAKAESDNEMYLRKLDRAQKLLDQVEEQMTRINLANQDSSIKVTELNRPSLPVLVSPILLKFLAVGTLLGGLTGLGLVYLLESKSRTFRNSEEIARTLGLRVLAHIPVDTQKLPKLVKGEVYPYQDIDPGLSSIHRPHSMTSESVRRLRTSVLFEAAATGAKVIQISSPIPEDGKSTLAGNLAISIAQTGKTVVLLDADLRRPQTSSSFTTAHLPGLTELIDGGYGPEEVIHPTAIQNLLVVPSGPIPANPAEALSMPQFADFLDWLRQRYDYIIVDTPPLMVVTDPTIVAANVDGIVMTFRVRRGCRPQAKESAAILRSIGKPVFGCVVNRVDDSSTGSGYVDHQASAYYHGRRYTQFSPGSSPDGKKSGKSKEFVITGNRQSKMNTRSPNSDVATEVGSDSQG